MINKKNLFVISLCLVGIAAFASFKANMNQFRSNLLKLAPYIYSSTEYSDEKNKDLIESKLKQLVKIGHKIDPEVKKKLSDKDPSLNYIVNHLEDDFKASLEAFQEKKFAYSQNVIKSAINRCFQCHSQSFRENQSMTKLEPKSLSLLSAEERADLLVAIRNFKEARTGLAKKIKEIQFNEQQQYEVENLIQKYLLVSIRTNTPKAEIEDSLKELKKKKLPKYLSKKIDSYLGSLDNYSPEKSKSPDFEKAKALIKKADSKKDYTFDASALVESLSAAKILHSLLEKDAVLDKAKMAESYYLLGKAYQSINEPAYWDLHESYFSRCIQVLPRSQLAKTCFKRFRTSVELRHSGSAGMFIPVRQKMRLQELKQLSGM